MAHSGEIRLLALLGLRLKGFASADAVAEVVGQDPGLIAAELDDCVADGLAVFNPQRQVYLLNPAQGRSEGERLLASQLDRLGVRQRVENAYGRFLELNPEILQLCTDWQICQQPDGERTLNDHSDPDYDAQGIDRLGQLDARLRDVLAELGSAIDRYSVYGPRFGTALRLLDEGNLEYFTKPIIPSYHTVWFELHEDLLATLGRDRASELPDRSDEE